MTLTLYDTRARAVVEVQPARPRLLTLYCCGPTVYRDAHVGNLRTFLLGDLLRRAAELDGLQVRMVQNITDVGHMADDDDLAVSGEDKVLAGAAAEGRGPMDVARHYEAAFHHDLALLGIRPAHAYPRASESIGLMLDLIERLVELGHAYAGADGSVFFDATSFPSYGALSGNRVDELRPGNRAEESVTEAKRFHADWALWKAAGDRAQLVWESPWGPGFPGWHVECSAMSMHFLGDVVDVHTGGIDLRFPHHEDERAQSDAAAGHEVVRHWVHGEHLLFEGRKMAKSTGNVVLLRDVVARGYDPLALRMAFLGSRYRTQVDLSWDAIAAADRQLTRWRQHVAAWAEQPSRPVPAEVVAQLAGAFLDDLDTPRALQVLRRLERDSAIPAGAKFETFAYADRVLGLELVRDVGRPRTDSAPAAGLPAGATELLAARAVARTAKDWHESDRLRDALADLGVVVTDTSAGQTWTLPGAAP